MSRSAFFFVGCCIIHSGLIMKIQISSVLVDDQGRALKFYTEVLGFVKKNDIPVGEFKWLTVVSPEGPDDMELLLEPNNNPAAKTYQKAIFEQEIPATTFTVEDVQKEYEKSWVWCFVPSQPRPNGEPTPYWMILAVTSYSLIRSNHSCRLPPPLPPQGWGKEPRLSNYCAATATVSE